MKIFIAEGDNARGPYTVDEIRKLLRAGAVEQATLGCREGESEWYPLATILREQPPTSAPVINSHVPQSNEARKSSFRITIIAAIVTIAISAGFAFAWMRDGELSGEVFIVTGGGESIKLGLVPVSIYPLDEIQGHLQHRTLEYDRDIAAINKVLPNAKSEMDEVFEKVLELIRNGASSDERVVPNAAHKKARDRYLELLAQKGKLDSGGFYLTGMPKEIYSVKTDSNGRYAIKLPRREKFALVAVASRRVGQGLEAYYWVVNASLDGAAQKNVPLSNHNMSTSGSAESLIHDQRSAE